MPWPLSLADLFNTRRQLILYHFMFAPGVHGWPSAGCPGCSMFVDQIGHLAHFAARDTARRLVSSCGVQRNQRWHDADPIAFPLNSWRSMGYCII